MAAGNDGGLRSPHRQCSDGRRLIWPTKIPVPGRGGKVPIRYLPVSGCLFCYFQARVYYRILLPELVKMGEVQVPTIWTELVVMPVRL